MGSKSSAGAGSNSSDIGCTDSALVGTAGSRCYVVPAAAAVVMNTSSDSSSSRLLQLCWQQLAGCVSGSAGCGQMACWLLSQPVAHKQCTVPYSQLTTESQL